MGKDGQVAKWRFSSFHIYQIRVRDMIVEQDSEENQIVVLDPDDPEDTWHNALSNIKIGQSIVFLSGEYHLNRPLAIASESPGNAF